MSTSTNPTPAKATSTDPFSTDPFSTDPASTNADDLAAALAAMDDDLLPNDRAGGEAIDGDSGNYYPDVYAFVVGFWAPTFAHDVREQNTAWRWCSHWFHHVEAMVRLEACWKAWEVLRVDPGTGASIWLRDHADPCLAALTAPDGPFKGCSDETHQLPTALPTAPLPAGLTSVGSDAHRDRSGPRSGGAGCRSGLGSIAPPHSRTCPVEVIVGGLP